MNGSEMNACLQHKKILLSRIRNKTSFLTEMLLFKSNLVFGQAASSFLWRQGCFRFLIHFFDSCPHCLKYFMKHTEILCKYIPNIAWGILTLRYFIVCTDIQVAMGCFIQQPCAREIYKMTSLFLRQHEESVCYPFGRRIQNSN